MANDAQIEAVVKADLSWFQKHERLILGLCLLCTMLWLGNKFLNNSAVAAKTAYGIQQAESEKARTAADLSAKQYQATIDALTKQNSALAATVAQRQVIVETKVKEVLVPKTDTEVLADLSAAYDHTYSSLTFVAPDVQRFTATKIERDAALADKADLQAVVKNQTTELGAAADVITKKDAEIASNDKTCKAQVALVKADAAKSKRNWFILGFIAGVGTRLLGRF